MNSQTSQIWIKIKKQNKRKGWLLQENGIHEKGMSKNYRVKVNNFPGGTSATILENIDQLAKSKPDCLIVHAGKNDLANGKNLLNQVKKNS